MSVPKRQHPGTLFRVERPLTLLPAYRLRSPGRYRVSRRGRLLLGLILSSSIGLLAYKRRSLSENGAIGAVATGTTIVGFGGWSWGLALVAFFVSSTLLSHFREREKESTAADKFSKGSRRDLGQVVANGGLASFYAALAGVTRATSLRRMWQAGFTGALATATADTWATELGVLSSRQPRLLTTGRVVAPGTSGGVTPLGSVASALGALTLGLAFWTAQGWRKTRATLPCVALCSGMLGSLCDSLLGATVQAMSFCPLCQCETERAIHACGTRTRPLRGLLWCNNDVVNFFSTGVGSCAAMVLHVVLRRVIPSEEEE